MPAGHRETDVVTLPNNTCQGTEEPSFLGDPGLCLIKFTEGLTSPRQIAFAPNGEVLEVLEA